MCFLARPHLHYSLAEPLACELAANFRQVNLLAAQVVAAAQPSISPLVLSRSWSLSCQQIEAMRCDVFSCSFAASPSLFTAVLGLNCIAHLACGALFGLLSQAQM